MPPGPQAGSSQACPESFRFLGFGIISIPLDASSAFRFRSPSRLTPDALLERLFHNVHHSGHGAGAACGSPPSEVYALYKWCGAGELLAAMELAYAQGASGAAYLRALVSAPEVGRPGRLSS